MADQASQEIFAFVIAPFNVRIGVRARVVGGQWQIAVCNGSGEPIRACKAEVDSSRSSRRCCVFRVRLLQGRDFYLFRKKNGIFRLMVEHDAKLVYAQSGTISVFSMHVASMCCRLSNKLGTGALFSITLPVDTAEVAIVQKSLLTAPKSTLPQGTSL